MEGLGNEKEEELWRGWGRGGSVRYRGRMYKKGWRRGKKNKKRKNCKNENVFLTLFPNFFTMMLMSVQHDEVSEEAITSYTLHHPKGDGTVAASDVSDPKHVQPDQ